MLEGISSLIKKKIKATTKTGNQRKKKENQRASITNSGN